MSAPAGRLLALYTDVLQAALTGSEDDIRAALDQMDESELSRLRNNMQVIADLAEHRRKGLRYVRGLS